MSLGGTAWMPADLTVFGVNYDALQAENDEKRRLKVLKSDFVNEFLSDVLKNKPE